MTLSSEESRPLEPALPRMLAGQPVRRGSAPLPLVSGPRAALPRCAWVLAFFAPKSRPMTCGWGQRKRPAMVWGSLASWAAGWIFSAPVGPAVRLAWAPWPGIQAARLRPLSPRAGEHLRHSELARVFRMSVVHIGCAVGKNHCQEGPARPPGPEGAQLAESDINYRL